MTLGIFAKTFVRPTVEEVFAAVAKHHLHWVHFNFSCAGLSSLPESVEPALLDRIRKAAIEHRIGIAGVSATFNMIHPDSRVRRDGLRRLGVIAATCSRLETKVVTLCTGTRDRQDMWRAHPDNETPAAWRDLLTSMTKALTTADKHDVTLAVEPETANVVSTARKARRLMDELRSPRLKIVMDPANLFRRADLKRSDEILEDAIDLLGPDLVMAHAKELSPDGHAGGLALGTGALDWDRYLGLLRKLQFPGPLIMHGFDEKHAAQSIQFLKSKRA